MLRRQRYHSSIPASSRSSTRGDAAPHVTIIRPVKGLEPSLYECLAATLHQVYPRDKLTIYFCISTRDDPAYPVLQRLIKAYPYSNVSILVEEDDPALQHVHDNGQEGRGSLGPNPKIRNMSRAYREAKGDIVWILDCNVWVGKGVCGRMVDTLEGFNGKMKTKFVHQLPLVVDIAGDMVVREENRSLLDPHHIDDVAEEIHASSSSASQTLQGNRRLLGAWKMGGGRLEELFMSSSHAKFYTAINTVLLAPCIVGKSNMFRRSHLNYLTQGQGIDFFSHNICEDHLIGDLLWRGQVAEEEQGGRIGKHAMVFGDLAIQPMAGMSVKEYIARRVRWLRVRKFTVTLATLVEPGTESLLCSLYGAFAATTLPWFHDTLCFPRSWLAFAVFWVASVAVWAAIDWTLYRKLHSAQSIEVDEHTPVFARSPEQGTRRLFREWLVAWLGREALAFPIWVWAVFGGVTVVWRGRRFWVGMDMRVHELERNGRALSAAPPVNGHGNGLSRKARRD
ncbi:hypothetical protein B0A49_08890 [Cryomyces minteri]|uniref:Ceramide glucosyltransferase n=1 Tax=Cryomyces minteri TaxID=331657 RepID=A0A4U0X822_9PEZI|nr:hypothetical protein B0A49_08890 [Cryomyces minteri]